MKNHEQGQVQQQPPAPEPLTPPPEPLLPPAEPLTPPAEPLAHPAPAKTKKPAKDFSAL